MPDITTRAQLQSMTPGEITEARAAGRIDMAALAEEKRRHKEMHRRDTAERAALFRGTGSTEPDPTPMNTF